LPQALAGVFPQAAAQRRDFVLCIKQPIAGFENPFSRPRGAGGKGRITLTEKRSHGHDCV